MNDDPTVLLSAAGEQILARLAAMDDDKAGELAVAVALRREYPAALVATATAQHELRLAARAKFGRAMRMLFTRDGYEQSSAEPVARQRATRFRDARLVADLCCGIGGDLIALAAGAPAAEVVAVDKDEVHARLAAHNAGVYDVAAQVRACVADVRDIPLARIDAVFIDPARRSGTRRFPAGVSQPPLDWCLSLPDRFPGAGARGALAVCVKAAPGLPAELIPAGWEAEFIADGRDLKEAALWSPGVATASRRATILPAGDTLTAMPGDAVPVAEPGEYLLDPNPAVTRAGLVEDLARSLGAWKIDQRIAFLSTPQEVRTPFARTLRVVESAPWNEKRFARRLRDLGVGAADLRRRGLAGDVELIHRRLKLPGTGAGPRTAAGPAPHRATVVLTRVADKPWGLICADPGSPLASP